MKTPLFVRDAQTHNETVYGRKNRAGYGTLQLGARISMRASLVSKAERTSSPDKLKGSLAIALSWLCAIANHLKVDLETAVWEHYPFKCPYCTDLPCHCHKLVERPKGRQIRPGHGIIQPSPCSLSDFQDMFKYIYPRNGLDGSIRHLLEETAELQEQLDLLGRGGRTEARFAKVCEELVDVFANLCAVANASGISLSGCFEKAFKEGCCTCHQIPCECPNITEEKADSVPAPKP